MKLLKLEWSIHTIPNEFGYPVAMSSHVKFKDQYETMTPLRREILS
jgi:hypothetical protein